MNSRALAMLLTVGGAVVMLWRGGGAEAPGLVGALLGLAAVLLVSGAARRVLAGVSALFWAGAVMLAVPDALLTAAGGAGLAGAVIAFWKGGSWPGWSSRYSRSPSPEEVTPRQMWESLDRGVDPTSGPED